MVILSSNFVWAAVLGLILVEWVRRSVWLALLRKTHPPIEPMDFQGNAPKISVIVPAKNEEKNISHCLAYLFRQSYPNFKIIVVDDRSDDRTPEILKELGKEARLAHKELKVIRIEKLPPGWTGKNHAMFAGSKAAQGEWILFTDADTTHGIHSVSSAVAHAVQNQIDFLTLSPETESQSFWEKTVQPLAASSLAFWFKPHKVNDDKNPNALANGQFILVKKEVYENIGGNEAVKTEVVEDVALARRARKLGFKVRFENGSKLYRTRMYSTLAEIVRGWTRILVYLFNKNIPQILHKIFLYLFFSCLPFFVLITELVLKCQGSGQYNPTILGISAAVSGIIVLLRFIGNKLVRSNPWFALLHLLGSVVMVWILSLCIWRIALHRPSVWRGDSYN